MDVENIESSNPKVVIESINTVNLTEFKFYDYKFRHMPLDGGLIFSIWFVDLGINGSYFINYNGEVNKVLEAPIYRFFEYNSEYYGLRPGNGITEAYKFNNEAVIWELQPNFPNPSFAGYSYFEIDKNLLATSGNKIFLIKDFDS